MSYQQAAMGRQAGHVDTAESLVIEIAVTCPCGGPGIHNGIGHICLNQRGALGLLAMAGTLIERSNGDCIVFVSYTIGCRIC